MRLCFWIAFCYIFLVSCSAEKKNAWTLHNQTSEILTVIKADQTSIRLIEGFCFKLAVKDFPLLLMFSNNQASLSLNEPGHYVLENLKSAQKTSVPCKPTKIE